jgi:hypothetical protein
MLILDAMVAIARIALAASLVTACAPGMLSVSAVDEEAMGGDVCKRGSLEECAAACTKGDAVACDVMGHRVCREEGVVECAKACDRGSLAACTTLGEMYDEGDRVAKSEARGRGLMMLACDGGHADACERLGLEAIEDGARGEDEASAAHASAYFHRACVLDERECPALTVFASR